MLESGVGHTAQTIDSMTQVAAETLGLPLEKVRSTSAAPTFPQPRRMAVPTPWRPRIGRACRLPRCPSGAGEAHPSRTSAPRCSARMSRRWSGMPAASAAKATPRLANPMARSSPVLAVSRSRPAPPPPEIPRRRGNIPCMPSTRCSPRCRSIPISALPAFAGRSASMARGGSSIPRLAHSQCAGGMVGGIGMALQERTALDARDGRVVNASHAKPKRRRIAGFPPNSGAGATGATFGIAVKPDVAKTRDHARRSAVQA
jgi:xanthine dehydrogenase YagR molybdenum-binding subunit